MYIYSLYIYIYGLSTGAVVKHKLARVSGRINFQTPSRLSPWTQFAHRSTRFCLNYIITYITLLDMQIAQIITCIPFESVYVRLCVVVLNDDVYVCMFSVKMSEFYKIRIKSESTLFGNKI